MEGGGGRGRVQQLPGPSGVIQLLPESYCRRATAGEVRGWAGQDRASGSRPGSRSKEVGQSSLGLVMRDNSVLSLGPESRLVVESFQFAPEKGALASVMRLAKGSAACITGEIAKLSPGTVQVLTPTAVIGIRGTHFLVHAEGGPDMEPKTEGGR